jgi:hypothetical protein
MQATPALHYRFKFRVFLGVGAEAFLYADHVGFAEQAFQLLISLHEVFKLGAD